MIRPQQPPQYQPQVDPGYLDLQRMDYPPDQFNKNYETYDGIEAYGSIIKDLTDTKDMLDLWELTLQGKKKLDSGAVVDDPLMTAYIKKPQAARDFVDIVRSVVNRHNDFSYISEKQAANLIYGANYNINRWLMLQSDDVPLRYRSKISFEAMARINSSVYKAVDGKMLTWTKGSFQEGRQVNERPEESKKSLMSYIIPFGKNRR